MGETVPENTEVPGRNAAASTSSPLDTQPSSVAQNAVPSPIAADTSSSAPLAQVVKTAVTQTPVLDSTDALKPVDVSPVTTAVTSSLDKTATTCDASSKRPNDIQQVDDKQSPPQITGRDAAKPGTVASRIQVFNVAEGPKSPAKSVVSPGAILPSRIAKPKVVKIVPPVVPMLEVVEIPDPAGTISASGRRQTQMFQAPAGRRTSRAYEHHEHIKEAMDGLKGKWCPHHQPGERLFVSDKGVTIRTRHHDASDPSSPWHYWAKKDENEKLPAERCDECLAAAGLPPLHYQIQLGHAPVLSKPSKCIDTAKNRRSASSEDQLPSIKGMFRPRVESSVRYPNPSIPGRATMSQIGGRRMAEGLLADYAAISSMLDDVVLAQSRRLREIGLKMAHELETMSGTDDCRLGKGTIPDSDVGGGQPAGSKRTAGPSHGDLLMLYATSALLKATADSWQIDVAHASPATDVHEVVPAATLAIHEVQKTGVSMAEAGAQEVPVVVAVAATAVPPEQAAKVEEAAKKLSTDIAQAGQQDKGKGSGSRRMSM